MRPSLGLPDSPLPPADAPAAATAEPDQDPGAEEEEEDLAWPKLRDLGWYNKKGTGLVDYYYVRPGKTVEGGAEGTDYFLTEAEAVEASLSEP